jgi:hypothetical protein
LLKVARFNFGDWRLKITYAIPKEEKMSKIVAIKIDVVGDAIYSETGWVRLRMSILEKLCSVVHSDKQVILGRWGTNKAALKKLLNK